MTITMMGKCKRDSRKRMGGRALKKKRSIRETESKRKRRDRQKWEGEGGNGGD